MKSFLGIFTYLISFAALASAPITFGQKGIRYRTHLGNCPTKSGGEIAIQIMKEYEQHRSLRGVKEKILSEKWDERYFLSDYRISHNPVTQSMNIQLDCPDPLLKVQIYKDTGKEHYSAILVSNGKLFDPAYENLLKAEKRLKGELPRLAIPVKYLEGSVHEMVTSFARAMGGDIRGKISEIIVNENKEMMIIFSLNGRASTVFMGDTLWEEKLPKLTKVVGYMEKTHKVPTTINFTNPKKVVVKF